MPLDLLRPCIDCGVPASATRCTDCAPPPRAARQHKLTAAQRGYTTAWAKLSRRARKMQPFCSDCGARDDLTADHTPEAWARHDAGKPIRLADIDVVCRSCNSKRGAARGPLTRGDDPSGGGTTALGEPRRPLHTGRVA